MSSHLPIGDIADCMSFLDASPSPFHAATNIGDRLRAAGATEIDLRAAWSERDVRGFQFTRREGAIVGWRLNDTTTPQALEFRIAGAHTDSPCLRVKPKPDVNAYGWRQLDVEVYGGVLNNSWLDRDLGIAGRVISSTGEERLIRTGPIARVPQLAIHLDRAVNDGLRLDPQTHLSPIWGLQSATAPSFVAYLENLSGVAEIEWWDLSLFDTQPAQLLGVDHEFLASGRLDNLLSCWSATTALISSPMTARVSLVVCNDHEEVGSASTTGAAGPLLEHVLVRINEAIGGTAASLAEAYSRSSCISADNAHAIHPNYPERHDHAHAPLVNSGPAIKVNVNQRYATSATTAQRFASVCASAGVPTQVFSSRNNMPCGSTIGPITATRLGIDTVDVGIPQLSMHSARELCGVDDPIHLARALQVYWS